MRKNFTKSTSAQFCRILIILYFIKNSVIYVKNFYKTALLTYGFHVTIVRGFHSENKIQIVILLNLSVNLKYKYCAI